MADPTPKDVERLRRKLAFLESDAKDKQAEQLRLYALIPESSACERSTEYSAWKTAARTAAAAKRAYELACVNAVPALLDDRDRLRRENGRFRMGLESVAAYDFDEFVPHIPTTDPETAYKNGNDRAAQSLAKTAKAYLAEPTTDEKGRTILKENGVPQADGREQR